MSVQFNAKFNINPKFSTLSKSGYVNCAELKSALGFEVDSQLYSFIHFLLIYSKAPLNMLNHLTRNSDRYFKIVEYAKKVSF